MRPAQADLPFTFIHKCALAFGIEITDLLEGCSANLSQLYASPARAAGQHTARETGHRDSATWPPISATSWRSPITCTYDYTAEAQQRSPST